MYGIYLKGYKRPTSKKEVKEAINTTTDGVMLENTSLFGGYDGLMKDAPDGTYTFVGPDPYTHRKFYGNITVVGGVVKKVT